MENELYHHGILGQKWGVRRFQKVNGALTAAGKRRYETAAAKHDKAAAASFRDAKELRKNGYNEEADAVYRVGQRQQEKAKQIRALGQKTGGHMTKNQKIVAGVGGAFAVKAIADTVRNASVINEMMDGVGKLGAGQVATSAVFQAGKMAVVGGLLAYGGVKAAEAIKANKKDGGSK